MTAPGAHLPHDEVLASIDALVGRARAGALSFTVDPEGPDAQLARLLADAEVDEGARSKEWTSVTVEFTGFLRGIEEDLKFLAVVRTGDGPAVTTWLNWGADVRTVLRPGVAPRTHGAHARRLHIYTHRRLLRLQLLCLVVPAAVRIAALLTTPASAPLALPIAFRLCRSMVENVQAQKALGDPDVQ